MTNFSFYPGELLLPSCPLETWSVIACDQFTAQPEYWQQVTRIIGDNPSSADLIFPEAFLDKIDFNKKITQISESMEQYLERGLFQKYSNAMFYIERTLHDGSIRRGIAGLLDLEDYDYHKDSVSLIRATEGPVMQRIPPRIKIREQAMLETSHIIMLIDDEEKTVIEPIAGLKDSFEKLYDFDLMQGGGHLSGWLIDPGYFAVINDALSELARPDRFAHRYELPEAPVLLYAVGDGNHSLAAAKDIWEKTKIFLTPEEQKNHPARYALAELNNLHDNSLQFEAIHRAVFVPDPEGFTAELAAYAAALRGAKPAQRVTIVTREGETELEIPSPERALAVGTIQDFLNEYLENWPGQADYIHGDDVVRELAKEHGAVGILLPAMQKNELFKTVIQEGTLPRKTFSMGDACDKRYYLECRRIRL